MPINAQISWSFPARPPEPTPENLRETAAIVSSLRADFGLAHDGDADRLVMVNSFGRVVPDSVVSILALRALGRHSGKIILSENTSSAVEEEAKLMGLDVVRSRIGKTFVEIGKEEAVFASEPSKIVDPSWGMWEDGMYCAVLVTAALTKDASLLEVLNSQPRWHYRQLNIPVSVDFSKLVEHAEEIFSRFRISEVRRLDGMKLFFDDQSWVMFRASGTESKTRIYCESREELRLMELVDAAKKVVENAMIPVRVR